MLSKFIRTNILKTPFSASISRQYFVTINSITEFYKDNKKELQENPKNYAEFSHLAKHLVFTFSICSNPINEFRELESTLVPYLKNGISTLDQNVTQEDVALMAGIFHIFLKAKENHIEVDAKQCFLNYYSRNFKGQIAPFLNFINWLSNLTKLSDPRISGEMIYICRDCEHILNNEKTSLTPLHKIQLAAFMLNFELNDERLLTIDNCIKDVVQVN